MAYYEQFTKKPVNKVVLKGTTLGTPMSPNSAIELDEGGQPVKYKKCLMRMGKK